MQVPAGAVDHHLPLWPKRRTDMRAVALSRLWWPGTILLCACLLEKANPGIVVEQTDRGFPLPKLVSVAAIVARPLLTSTSKFAVAMSMLRT
jgi:hypothetical protein